MDYNHTGAYGEKAYAIIALALRIGDTGYVFFNERELRVLNVSITRPDKEIYRAEPLYSVTNEVVIKKGWGCDTAPSSERILARVDEISWHLRRWFGYGEPFYVTNWDGRNPDRPREEYLKQMKTGLWRSCPTNIFMSEPMEITIDDMLEVVETMSRPSLEGAETNPFVLEQKRATFRAFAAAKAMLAKKMHWIGMSFSDFRFMREGMQYIMEADDARKGFLTYMKQVENFLGDYYFLALFDSEEFKQFEDALHATRRYFKQYWHDAVYTG